MRESHSIDEVMCQKPKPNLKLAAEIYRVGLEKGYVEPKEIIAWADSVIADSELPGIEIIDVALGGDEKHVELASRLSRIPGSVDQKELTNGILMQMASAIHRDPSLCRQIAFDLFQMYLEDNVPDDQSAGMMGWFDDAFDLAELGYSDTPVEAVRIELVRFLSRWGHPTLVHAPGG